MRIDRLELKNYRGFTSLNLDFTGHRTTVLVGSNGCGKTSILDGLATMLKCIAYTLTSYEPGYKNSNLSPSFVPLDVNNKRTQLDLYVFLVLNGVAINFGITYKSSDLSYMTRLSGDYSKDFEAVYRSGVYPVLVYYPVSRAVLDIPLRIDESRSFTQVDAYDGALDSNKRNFQTFFQWYRDREDLENEARQEPGFAPDAQLQLLHLCAPRHGGRLATVRQAR